MNIHEVFKEYVMIADCVPIGIPELGFLYLNDNGMWNLTINSKSSACHHKTVTAEQLLDICRRYSKYFPTQEEKFHKELPEFLALVKALDPKEVIRFE